MSVETPAAETSRAPPPTSAAIALIAFMALVGFSAGCLGDPCPNGILEGDLAMQDDEYLLPSGGGSQFARIGGLGEAGIEDCREIHGVLVFGDDVSSFADFDALEYVAGTVQFQGTGYPTRVFDGVEREVVEGFGSLVQIDRHLSGNARILGMSALEFVGGRLSANAVALFSLREVGIDLGASSVDGSLDHLANLEVVGRDFSTGSGGIGDLQNLRYVGRDFTVGRADAVDFTPPALEEVGRDLRVGPNGLLYEVAVPSMTRVGGILRFVGNGPGLPDVSERILEAFSDVEVGGYTYVCGNGGDDPCPQDPHCWDFFTDEYCCGDDPCLGHETCPGRDQCSS